MLNIVIPMAGRGSRMADIEAVPKPLIEVMPGRRMIDYVVEYLQRAKPDRFIFVAQEEHVRRFALADYLRARVGDHTLVLTRDITRGPADTALLAAGHIDNRDELLVAYCDSALTIDMPAYLAQSRAAGADGALLLYPSSAATNSYAVTDAAGRVLRTAEKEMISHNATAGLYYFREGRRFVRGARRLVAAHRPGGPEVFVCPVYNELIAEGGLVVGLPMDRDDRIEMGTPDDLRIARGRLARETA